MNESSGPVLRIGAILSGPLFALGGITTFGHRCTFLASAGLTLKGLMLIAAATRHRTPRPRGQGTGA